MRPAIVTVAVLLASICAAACSGGAQDGPGATSASARPSLPELPSAASVRSRPAGPPSGAPKLAPSDAPAEEREAAALKVLRGDAAPKLLAVEATDNGFPLDPGLRDKIAPRSRPPSVKMGATSVQGRLPPEVIQRIVRQNFGRFRLCYETALQNDPALEGNVEVRFTIDATGAVSKVGEGTSTIKDAAMRTCVTSAFKGLSFPQPEGGVVTVVYPILFAPPVE